MKPIIYDNNQTIAPTCAYEAPAAGAYPVGITAVTDHESESYLEVQCDIIDGPFAGYYTRWRAEHPDWRDPLTYRRYYTPRALQFFQRFCDAVSRSNGNYIFDGSKINADERTLVGKRLGVVLREVEYYTNSGDLRTRLEVFREVPVDRVPYTSAPKISTIAEQEARKARRQGTTPAPAPASAQPAPAPTPAQAFAQQPAQPAQAPAYQQPAQAFARQTATPAYAQAQQPAQQAYTQAQALAQFVDVSGSMDEMPFA